MLGGYYLGQLYLGQSGSPSTIGILVIQSATHGHYIDDIILLQYHNILLDDSTHSLSSDSINLVRLYTILVRSGIIGTKSNNITLSQLYNLLLNDSLHTLSSDNILKITNWDELNVFFGTYIKKFEDSGILDILDKPDTSIYIIDKEKLGSFENKDIDDTGIYIKQSNKQGLL